MFVEVKIQQVMYAWLVLNKELMLFLDVEILKEKDDAFNQ